MSARQRLYSKVCHILMRKCLCFDWKYSFHIFLYVIISPDFWTKIFLERNSPNLTFAWELYFRKFQLQWDFNRLFRATVFLETFFDFDFSVTFSLIYTIKFTQFPFSSLVFSKRLLNQIFGVFVPEGGANWVYVFFERCARKLVFL